MAEPADDHKESTTLPEVSESPVHQDSISIPDENRIEDATPTPPVLGADKKSKRSRKVHIRPQDKPITVEVLSWYLYELCTYFIQTTLIPIVFPLIISQIVASPPEPAQGWTTSFEGFLCPAKEMQLYERLTYRQMSMGNLKFSPLGWTSISWAIGLILAAPLLGVISTPLDYGGFQQLIYGAATLVGALFCLPVGFFKTVKIFPPYISIIIAAHVIAISSHTRHLGLMIRGFTGLVPPKDQLQTRSSVGGWLSTYATALGSLGSAIIAAFTYHMLKESEEFISLWVVSIFSGLKWLVGVLHIVLAYRPGNESNEPVPKTHMVSVFKYPHGLGSLVGVFLSSFTTMCIFTGGLLFLVGQLCIKPPIFFLYLWLTYFIFPSISLPLLQPLQRVIKADAVKMQVLGFMLAVFTSGMGFYFRDQEWSKGSILVFAGIQSTSAGVLHCFGRVLLLNCAPAGREGAFSVWYSWLKGVGTCLGFAVASASRGGSFGVAFVGAVLGVVMLIFGNVSDVGGAVDAGHLDGDDEEEGVSPSGLYDKFSVKDL